MVFYRFSPGDQPVPRKPRKRRKRVTIKLRRVRTRSRKRRGLLAWLFGR